MTTRSAPDALRPLRITRNFTDAPEGSVLIEAGGTRVLCTASVDRGVPSFLRDSGRGWLTAEYALLPRSTDRRTPRESVRGKLSGRTQEISRLVGRALRASLDFEILGEHTVTIDCDVLQADGGTRCASITGGMTALCDAVTWMEAEGLVDRSPVLRMVAAVSVGMVGKTPVLDLCYEEDSAAEVDMNVVMDDRGRYIEIQGTAEGEPFSDRQFAALRRLAKKGVAELIEAQRRALEEEGDAG